jgi:hypothetical protein
MVYSPHEDLKPNRPPRHVLCGHRDHSPRFAPKREVSNTRVRKSAPDAFCQWDGVGGQSVPQAFACSAGENIHGVGGQSVPQAFACSAGENIHTRLILTRRDPTRKGGIFLDFFVQSA